MPGSSKTLGKIMCTILQSYLQERYVAKGERGRLW